VTKGNTESGIGTGSTLPRIWIEKSGSSGLRLLRMRVGIQALWRVKGKLFDEMMRNFELERDNEFTSMFAPNPRVAKYANAERLICSSGPVPGRSTTDLPRVSYAGLCHPPTSVVRRSAS
jgi:hypothetical protein